MSPQREIMTCPAATTAASKSRHSAAASDGAWKVVLNHQGFHGVCAACRLRSIRALCVEFGVRIRLWCSGFLPSLFPFFFPPFPLSLPLLHFSSTLPLLCPVVRPCVYRLNWRFGCALVLLGISIKFVLDYNISDSSKSATPISLACFLPFRQTPQFKSRFSVSLQVRHSLSPSSTHFPRLWSPIV